MYPHTQAPPKELQELVKQCYSIPRFTRIYREGIFDDDTGSHIARCVNRADKVDINLTDKETVKLILWVHDLPEIEISDYSVIQKIGDRELNNKLEISELEVAKKIIPDKFFDYFVDFKNAEDLLSGKTPKKIPSKHALIAKMIDSIDGNETFHQQLTDWIVSERFKPEDLPQQGALEYSFDHCVKIHKLIAKSPEIFVDFVFLAKNMLSDEISSIAKYWGRVENAIIPDTIKKGFVTVEDIKL